MHFNWLPVLGASLIPLLVGFVYYHDRVLGTFWKRHAQIDEERLKAGNFPLILVFTVLLGIVLAGFLLPVVFHFLQIFSVTAPVGGGVAAPDSEGARDAMMMYDKYGQNFRTFGHGIIHGTLAALTGIWPVIAVNAMFERRGWRYTAVHTGYWVITLALMGGVICAFG